MTHSLLLLTDSYKVGMDKMNPPKTEYVYSYIEARGGPSDDVLFFGLQMFIKNYLLQPITMGQIDEAEEFWTSHGEPFNRSAWEHILNAHNGYLPVLIKAVPEGTIVPIQNVLVTIVNTDPKCFWLTTWLETILLQGVWFPTTVATNSWRCKKIIKTALDKSCDNPDYELPYRMNDFGFRGVSSVESAGIGGLAHLVSFMGTDNAAALVAARRFYHERMAGHSIPASEHSVMCAWGREGEVDAMRNMLKQFGKKGAIFACVSDTYDIFHATKHIWGGVLKQEVIDSGATLVVRPDSGRPDIVPIDLVEILSEQFGYTVNSKGYKVLPVRADGTPIVRVIQGDGITVDSLPQIVDNLLARGFSAETLAYGQGGGLLQKLDRDTYKFAQKASAVCIDGVWTGIAKDPVTDPGKRSKKGRLALIRDNGALVTVQLEGNESKDLLEPVFANGKLLRDETLATIRVRAA